MNKRIILGRCKRNGELIHQAKVQVRLIKGVWFTVTRIEDPDREYVLNSAQERLQYMENEEYKENVKL